MSPWKVANVWKWLPRTFTRYLKRSSVIVLGGAVTALAACSDGSIGPTSPPPSPQLVASGQQIFRFSTFGDEKFWTDTLHMERVIQQAVDPTTALSVGLKVDMDTLPADVIAALKAGQVDLRSPATTVLLIKLGAVVGIRGTVVTVNGRDSLTRVGITCAVCHSTVDNALAPGIGHRLDGWPNRDLNPGAIIGLSPALTPAQKAVYNSWGAGKYDARYNFDGKNDPTVIPPAYGLAGINSVIFTGDGKNLEYWNRYVAVTQMHGQGNFSEPRLGINVTNPSPNLVESMLPALQAYQLSISAPAPPAGSFDATAAARGQLVFTGQGKCSQCHVGATFTDANIRLHAISEIPTDPTYALRSATKMWRTSPLKGVWQHPPYFHDGSAATLADVVDRYNSAKSLNLTAQQKADLVQYLKSL